MTIQTKKLMKYFRINQKQNNSQYKISVYIAVFHIFDKKNQAQQVHFVNVLYGLDWSVVLRNKTLIFSIALYLLKIS